MIDGGRYSPTARSQLAITSIVLNGQPYPATAGDRINVPAPSGVDFPNRAERRQIAALARRRRRARP